MAFSSFGVPSMQPKCYNLQCSQLMAAKQSVAAVESELASKQQWVPSMGWSCTFFKLGMKGHTEIHIYIYINIHLLNAIEHIHRPALLLLT